jgi:hypothetical protein
LCIRKRERRERKRKKENKRRSLNPSSFDKPNDVHYSWKAKLLNHLLAGLFLAAAVAAILQITWQVIVTVARSLTLLYS